MDRRFFLQSMVAAAALPSIPWVTDAPLSDSPPRQMIRRYLRVSTAAPLHAGREYQLRLLVRDTTTNEWTEFSKVLVATGQESSVTVDFGEGYETLVVSRMVLEPVSNGTVYQPVCHAVNELKYSESPAHHVMHNLTLVVDHPTWEERLAGFKKKEMVELINGRLA